MKNLLRLWPELIWLPVALCLYWISPEIIRIVDPTAGQYDGAVLQKLIYCSVAILVLNVIAWLGIRFNFRTLFQYYANEFPSRFDYLSTWQKSCLLLSCYLAYMLLGVVILLSL
jgi:hypothetical protein